MRFNLLLVFWLITIASAKPTSSKAKKPKRIGFLTALAIASKIGPELAQAYGPAAYKAMKKKYRRGKAVLKVKGEDGKMRDAKKGEAVQVDLSHPETYAIVDPKRKEATVAHPNLLSYTPPDERDIHITSNVIVEHAAYQYPKGYGYKGYAPAYGQQQYTGNSQQVPRYRAIKEVTLWPGFMEQLSDGTWIEAYHIPYTFSQDYPFTPQEQKLIRKVMDKFEQMTCVRFTPTWYEGQHHVKIENKPGGGCCSYAGIEKKNGNQSFNLESPACMKESVIAHELGHVAGLHHTQQRADRDQYINVFWDYINPKYKTDFQRFTNYLPQVPYDKRSVMHYMSNQGNAYPQYSSLTDSNNKPIVHERKIQLGDYHWINTSYQCEWYMQYTKSYFANWTSAS